MAAYVVDARSLEVVIGAAADTRNWKGIVDLRGNTDGLEASKGKVLAGATYFDWETSDFYMFDGEEWMKQPVVKPLEATPALVFFDITDYEAPTEQTVELSGGVKPYRATLVGLFDDFQNSVPLSNDVSVSVSGSEATFSLQTDNTNIGYASFNNEKSVGVYLGYGPTEIVDENFDKVDGSIQVGPSGGPYTLYIQNGMFPADEDAGLPAVGHYEVISSDSSVAYAEMGDFDFNSYVWGFNFNVAEGASAGDTCTLSFVEYMDFGNVGATGRTLTLGVEIAAGE